MLQQITLINYRNIAQAKLDLSNGVNLLVAQNGYGKTNLIESIYYPVLRNSFRPLHSYSELVGSANNFAKITLEWHDQTLETVLSSEPVQRKVTLNSKQSKIRTVLESFPLILFAPHSIDLVNGEPKIRRHDLDSFISLFNPRYLSALKTYDSVLKNRNAILKAIRERNAQKSELTFWTEKLIEHGAHITLQRLHHIDLINTLVPLISRQLYHDITKLEILYLSNIDINTESQEFSLLQQTFIQKYEENQEKEIIVGKTLYGPHKDDYTYVFQSKQLPKEFELKYHGSRGQQRIGSFLTKLAQVQLLQEQRSVQTLLLLDDIMSELDAQHRENIGEYLLQKKYQLLLTGADINEIPENVVTAAHNISLVSV